MLPISQRAKYERRPIKENDVKTIPRTLLPSSSSPKVMNPVPIQISKAKFDALCVIRSVGAEKVAPEVEWWSFDDDRVIGFVSLDLSDDTWVWQIMGRDQKGVFRVVRMDHSIETQDEASVRLHASLTEFKDDPRSVFPVEGVDDPGSNCDLLNPSVSPDKLHGHFKVLIESKEYSSAAALLREFSPVFTDIDGNFVEQFQTVGFNARLWELYLDRLFRELDFHRITGFDRPDFCLMKHGHKIAVEAVTVNPSTVHEMPEPQNAEEERRLRDDFMPLRFCTPLLNKLRKKYWELPHMKDIPFVLAIHDYFTDDSMTWSAGSLSQYLYGLRPEGFVHEDGTVDANFVPIEAHEWGSKRMPSGFFKQPGAENISAVLLNNAASLNKFNRMGRQAGLGNSDIALHRMGTRYDPDPKAAVPIFFSYEVSPSNPVERWGDEVVLYLNPNAKNEFPIELLDPSAFHFVEDGRIVPIMSPDHIFFSRTAFVQVNAAKEGHS